MPEDTPNELKLAAAQKNIPAREIKRSQIQLSKYNPRSMNMYARGELAKSIDDFGLVETLVWNEKTGFLVGGHQRLAKLDKDEGWPGKDYLVRVSVVSLNEKREKRLNVLLNNPALQGKYEKDLLFSLLGTGDDKLSLPEISMTRIDLEFDFGELPADMFAEPGLLVQQDAATEAVKKDITELKRRRKEAQKAMDNSPASDKEYYLLVAFDSVDEKEAWLKHNGFPEGMKVMAYKEIQAAIVGDVPDSVIGTRREVAATELSRSLKEKSGRIANKGI